MYDIWGALPEPPAGIQTWVDPRQEKRPVRRSTRVSKKRVHRLEFEESHAAEEAVAFVVGQDPVTLEEALSRPDAQKWRRAIEKGLQYLKANMTYEEVTPPANVKPVETKWVFRPKTHADGSLDKYKARLIAKGFTERYGEDYTETFSPVVQHDSFAQF
ncbi:hypothetical protein ON010_g12939 [Phytophthora cinnamomi]|nr:hypothetical protein ON010_g12939 [Phytophthora cinnamomi]